MHPILKLRLNIVLTFTVDAFIASSTRARVAVDVVGTRVMHTRAASTLVGFSCEKLFIDALRQLDGFTIMHPILKFRLNIVLTFTVDTLVSSGARARVAVDVVRTRAVHTRATGTFVDFSYKKMCIDA